MADPVRHLPTLFTHKRTDGRQIVAGIVSHAISGPVNIALNSLPNNRFKLEGYTPPSNLARVSLGVSHRLTTDLMLQAAYNARKSDGVMQQGVNIGVSLNF